MGPGRLIFPTWCLQHKVASIMEGLTDGLGLVGPVYCTVALLQSGETVSELLEHVSALLQAQLLVTPADLADENDPWRRQSMLALLQASVAQRHADEEGEHQSASTKQTIVADFLDFFGSDWTGPPVRGRETRVVLVACVRATLSFTLSLSLSLSLSTLPP